MTQRDWHRLFTDEELEAYGRLADSWTFTSNTSNLADQLGQWVRYNSDGTYTFSWNSPKRQEKAPVQELEIGDTKPLDDFLETFTVKE